MKEFVFITGNQHKADYLVKWLGMPVNHKKIDLDELQSLDLRTVVEHKVKQAYDIVKQPVLVEDLSLSFTALGRLPGTLIKWFLEELGNEGLCKLANGLEHRKAEARLLYALYDGEETHLFEGLAKGEIVQSPRGNNGFGWNPVFVPEGATKTYAEMTDNEVEPYSPRAMAISKLREYLEKH